MIFRLIQLTILKKINTKSRIINEAIGAFREPFVPASTSNTLSSNISQVYSLPESGPPG